MTLPLEKKPRWFTTELAATLFAAVPTLRADRRREDDLTQKSRGLAERHCLAGATLAASGTAAVVVLLVAEAPISRDADDLASTA